MAPQREWFEKDYYKILGVSSTATDKEITSAYRKLAKQHHPDANPGQEDRSRRSARPTTSWVTPTSARSTTRSGHGPGRGRCGFPGGFGGGTFRVEDMGDLGDLFGGLFGRGRRSGGAGGPERGADIETELHLSFEDAVNGVTTSVNVTTDVRCQTCRGPGPRPAPSRSPARAAAARAPSRTTRACSR